MKNAAKAPKDWKCEDCGRRLTFRQAEKASVEGCTRCNSTMVELDDMDPCSCGHPLYLHDDGTDACVSCWVESEKSGASHLADCMAFEPKEAK
jgi:DNA-directed RNA polymerase subunit RPC12/RpoP